MFIMSKYPDLGSAANMPAFYTNGWVIYICDCRRPGRRQRWVTLLESESQVGQFAVAFDLQDQDLRCAQGVDRFPKTIDTDYW